MSTCLVLVVAVAVSGQEGPDQIDRYVERQMREQKIPGLGLAVIDAGKVTKARGYGFSNLEHRVAATPETMYQSGSVGKQLTAAAVMLQVEDGKLALSDPIARFFPEAPAFWRDITVEHLLTHTSGLPDYVAGQIDYRRDYTEEELTQFAFALKPEFPAGARWNYSNTGYVLLGILVHKVSGSFYGDVLAERVFRPLGMRTARVINEADIVNNRAAGYRLVDDEVKNQEWVAPLLNTTADGSLYVSIRDMIAWDEGIRGGRILSKSSWERVLSPVRLNSGNTYPYGFGWALDERAGRPLQHHGGSWQGFRSHYSRFIGRDLSIVVLVNLAQANPERIVDGIAALIDPALAPSPLDPLDDDAPAVTARLTRLLKQASTGSLDESEFSYVRAGFFPYGTQRLQAQLEKLGALQDVTLVANETRGDDRLVTYRAQFANGTMNCQLAVTPDDKVSQFRLFER